MACERANPQANPPVERRLSSLDQSAWWLEIDGYDRWAIYHRLQTLAIDCHCQIGAPLQVRIESPQDLVQCWSVMRHAVFHGGDRLALAQLLERCWGLEAKS